jgi:hypothetical protein
MLLFPKLFEHSAGRPARRRTILAGILTGQNEKVS